MYNKCRFYYFNISMNSLIPTLSAEVKRKFATFVKFNVKETILEAKKAVKSSTKPQVKKRIIDLKQLSATVTLDAFAGEKKAIENEFLGLKSERRERLRKAVNLSQIINHYVDREHFQPTEIEKDLINRVASIKTYIDKMELNLDVDILLKKLISLMNHCVDANQMRFLCIVLHLTAEVCFSVNDLDKAVYFFNKARIFASYAELNQMKAKALMSLAEIAQTTKRYHISNKLLKKALQFAWRMKDEESELNVYDQFGTNFYYMGEINPAQYYHRRFAQGECESQDSAIKRISNEMLLEYDRNLNSLEKKNLTSLFLGYLNLPLSSFKEQPSACLEPQANYSDNNESPRKDISDPYSIEQVEKASKQLEEILMFDREFRDEIPFPDVKRNFVATSTYSRPRKNITFEKSSDYQKVVGISPPKLDFEHIYGYSTEKRVQRLLSTKVNENWWGQMQERLRKQQEQKIGQLKDRIRISHESYGKYPEERRRALSIQHERVKYCFNEALLDWIDPK